MPRIGHLVHISDVETTRTWCAASNVVATFCQYEALKYVSFPVQTLGKCAKMIPVMIWGSAVNGKTYKAKDYIIAVMVTLGCAMFAMTGARVITLLLALHSHGSTVPDRSVQHDIATSHLVASQCAQCHDCCSAFLLCIWCTWQGHSRVLAATIARRHWKNSREQCRPGDVKAVHQPL